MGFNSNLITYANRYPSIGDLALKAKKRMPHVAWEYLDSGTGDESLLQQNISAFDKIKFIPEFCKGELNAKVATELFGVSYIAPIGMAPIGLTGLMWPKAEQYLAATAQRMQIPYCLSTVATETPETIGDLVGAMGWFQLYPPKDKEVRDSLLKRAKVSGFKVLVVTADVPMASRRERSKKAGLAVPPKITTRLLWDGITHPIWTYYTLLRGLPRLRSVEHYTNNSSMKFVSGFVGNRLGGTLDWDYCKELKELWKGPVVLKGILSASDALKAQDIGLDGIYVSNHGARQFNGSITAIDALPSIVSAVKGQLPILFDSGVRSGLDVMRALHLGADFVLAGRPFIHGVAALGKWGGDHVANILIDDLKNNMVQLGVQNIEALTFAQSIKD